MSTRHTLQAINQFWRHVAADSLTISPGDRAELNETNLRAVLSEGNSREVLARLVGEGVAPTTARVHGQGG